MFFIDSSVSLIVLNIYISGSSRSGCKAVIKFVSCDCRVRLLI